MNTITYRVGALFLTGLALAPADAQYKQVNLVSDLSTQAATITDPLLVNPWGMSSSPMSPLWVSDQGKNLATLYSIDGTTGAVAKVPLNVTIPASPTGQVFNGSSNFVVSQGGGSGPAVFIFADLNGTISGWNPGVPPPVPPAVSTQATLAATGTPTPVAYTGLALGMRGADTFLYAANNAAPGRIDVFDKNYNKVSVSGTFTDPSLPAGNSPFDVVNIGGNLYVTYSGPSGIVNVFTTDGIFLERFATGGTLLNPWGMALAPSDFGPFGNALLIGNFNFGNPAMGPGHISAFDPSTRAFLGLLKDTNGVPLTIDGLWTLKFGNGHSGGISNVLYFSAGIQNQAHGLVGSLTACTGPAISGVSASPNVLWPPNHMMEPVAVNYAVADPCDPAPVCSLSVSSNEEAGDSSVVNAHEVGLVAERNGNGGGRIYTITITITCEDKLNLSSSATVPVTVPHDHRKK